MNVRMRDLENKFLDFKTNFERRVLTLLEENPQKYLRHLKMLEDADSVLWKESDSKFLQMESKLNSVENLLSSSLEGQNMETLMLIKKVDELQFRLKSIENQPKEDQRVGRIAIANKAEPNEPNDKLILYSGSPGSPGVHSFDYEIEMKLMKEGLSQERNRRELLFADMLRMYQEIHTFVHKNESEVNSRIKRHQAELNEQQVLVKEEGRKLEELRLEKMNTDQTFIRSMVANLEKKIESEIEKRMGLANENRLLINEKLGFMKEEMKKGEKESLESEQQYLSHIQDSISALHQIIKGNKDQIDANLAMTQTLVGEDLKALTKSLEVLKENVQGRLGQMDGSVKEMKEMFGELQNHMHVFSVNIDRNFEKEVRRFEKIGDGFQEILEKGLERGEEERRRGEERGEEWRKMMEGKSVEIFGEVSSALKSLKVS